MSPRLALQFLGLPQLYLDSQPVATSRRKAIALLAYLAVNGSEHGFQTYSRELLSGLLWPENEQARAFSNLRTILWDLHQALGEGWLVSERERLSLNRHANIEVDVARFRQLLVESRRHTTPEQRIPLLVQATRVYRNHFLTGYSLKNAYAFNEWVYAEAEECRHQLAGALEVLADNYSLLGQADQAIPYARRLVTLDPLNEASHRKLMEVYIQAGQHNAALKQYQICEQILRKELGVDPQAETYALYKRIRKGEVKPVYSQKRSKPPYNLPAQLSTFIGREKEIDRVADLLGKHRLVTLTGAGGIGKTRLSLQVGQKLLPQYPDGVWFIAFDSISDADLVPQTVASVFELREAPGRSLLELLKSVLRDKTTLLILDNCEHVLDACAQLAVTLLANCQYLKILVTSREILNIAGEAVYPIPSLSMPVEHEVSFEQLSEYESIELFMDRATLALASFTLTQENARTVMDICRNLDGIPLAIELAAAQVPILQVTEIRDQLRTSFTWLSTDNRMASSRHQTLQASLDWSWGLLTPAEQKFLRQLAVFAGGWTHDAAQAVCDGDALGLMRLLVKKSLIVVDQGTRQMTRYRFHEIVRQYARQRLVEAGEEDETGRRHIAYFLKLSRDIESGLQGPEQMEWFARAEDERDNLRAALEWASRTDAEAGLYISSVLHSFWESFNPRESARWLRTFIQQPESNDFPHARAKALYTLGVIQTWSQEFTQAASTGQECLRLFQDCGDSQGVADALLLLGYASQNLGHRAQADELYERSLAVARSLGDVRRQALAWFRLGHDRPERQLANWEQAVALFRQAGDRNFVAGLLSLLARFRILLTGDIEKAQEELDEAIRLGVGIDKNIGIGGLWGEPSFAKSLIALLRGDYEQASALLQELVTLGQESGNRMGYLWARAHLGHVALRAGDLTEARTIFAETIRKFQEDQNATGVVFALEGLAGLSLAVGKPDHAAVLIGWADSTRERIANSRPFLEQANVDQIIAAGRARMGEAAFSESYEAGKRMTLAEAVAFAL